MKKIIVVLCILVVGVTVYFSFFKKTKVTITTQKDYLAQNYSLSVLKKIDSFEVILENTLDSYELDAKKLVGGSKYQDCDGKIIVNKLENNITNYTISTICKGEDKKVTVQIYKNMNQDSSFQIVTDMQKRNDGYVGILSNYIHNEDNNGFSSRYNGIGGLIFFDNDFKIKKVKQLKKEGMGVDVEIVSDGVLITERGNNTFALSYYDESFHLKNKKTYDITVTKYLYEDDTNFYFAYFNRIYQIEKKTLNEKLIYTLPIFSDYTYQKGYYMTVDKNIFYSYDSLLKEEKKENVKGDIIKRSEDIYIKNDNTIEVLGKEELGDTGYGHILDFEVGSDITILYDNSYSFPNDNEKVGTKVEKDSYTILSYDLNGEIKTIKTIKQQKVEDTLSSIDFSWVEKMRYTYLLDKKIVDIFYSDKENGTEIFFIYE